MTACDLCDVYRLLLAWWVGSYATVRLVMFVGRLQYIGFGDPRAQGLLRQYLLIQMLRVRVRRFSWDLLQIVALLLVFVLLVHRHWR